MRKTVGTTDRKLRGLLAAGAVAGAGTLGFTTGGGRVRRPGGRAGPQPSPLRPGPHR